MKKIISALLALALLPAFAACGKPAAVPNAPLVLGEKYLLDLDYEQALLQFDQAILIEPKNPRGYLGKADALLHMERPSDAAEALGAAARQCRPQRAALNEAQAAMGNSLAEACVALATAYETLGWREIALALLRRVCEELPGESRLKDALGRLLNTPAQTEPPKTSKTAEATTAEVPKKQVKRMTQYLAEGTVSLYDIYEHDAKGQTIRSERYAADGSLLSTSTYQYNDEGQCIRYDFQNSDGSSGYNINEYNADGDVARLQIVSSGEKSTCSYSYEHNAAGQTIRGEMHGSNIYWTNEYSAEGLLIRQNYYGDGLLTGYTVFEY